MFDKTTATYEMISIPVWFVFNNIFKKKIEHNERKSVRTAASNGIGRAPPAGRIRRIFPFLPFLAAASDGPPELPELHRRQRGRTP